jgi:hypothetical protein
MCSGKRFEHLKPLTLEAVKEFGVDTTELNGVLEQDVHKIIDMCAPMKRKEGPTGESTAMRPADFQHYFYSVGISATLWVMASEYFSSRNHKSSRSLIQVAKKKN